MIVLNKEMLMIELLLLVNRARNFFRAWVPDATCRFVHFIMNFFQIFCRYRRLKKIAGSSEKQPSMIQRSFQKATTKSIQATLIKCIL